jgi:putative ABC transport system permease protein
VNLLDGLGAAVESLAGNPLRSSLTALGIIIGVAAVVAMVAVGAGAERRVAEAISSVGSDLLLVSNGSRAKHGRQSGEGGYFSLTEDDALALARDLPGVQAAAGSVAGRGQVVYGNNNWNTTLRGINPDYFIARDWRIAHGRGFNPAELNGAATVALLGSEVVEQLFGGVPPIGQVFRIKRVPFRVVGTLAKKGPSPWGGNQDDVVFVPLGTAKKRLFGERQQRNDLLGQITVKAISAEAVKDVEGKVIYLLRQRHRIGPDQPSDFHVRNMAELFEARAESSRVMSVLLASVAGIALLVGGIGIMNIMLVSVTERKREIGLRMAVGARRHDIMVQFVIEALLLAVSGGIVGVAVGVAGSSLIARLAEWPVLIGAQAILVAAGFSVAVGLLFGYYPAHQAARLDPVEALRQE